MLKPEIRVWVHPASGGSDYWYVFPTVYAAKAFIQRNKTNPDFHVESRPLVGYGKYEMTLSQWKDKAKREGLKDVM